MDHFYDSIGGWFNFQELYSEMVRVAPDPAHFVEVGAWKGRSTAYMAVEIINSGKKIKFDVVDTWLGSGLEHDHDSDVQAGRLYQVFLGNLRPVEDHYTPHQMTSLEAAELFPDGSLDFVCIDGAHDYDSVCSDLRAWLPKVRDSGYIGGDDYAHHDVRRAVQDVLGLDHSIETRGSSWPSWLVKK